MASSWFGKLFGRGNRAPHTIDAGKTPTRIDADRRAKTGVTTSPIAPIEDMRRFIDREVRAGFLPLDEMPGHVTAIFAPEMPDRDVPAMAIEMIAEATATLRTAQQDWPAVTDYDRLDRAFDRLDSAGIITARHCVDGDIEDAIEDARDEAGDTPRGFCYFNLDDTDNAIAGHGLYLTHGYVPKPVSAIDEQAAREIGSEIVAALQDQGLTVEWNGDSEPTARIGVMMDWKRRLNAA